MTSFKRVVAAALFCACFAVTAHAVRPSPVKLLDSKLAPGCLKARASWLASQDNKGPAVAIIDKCKDDIVLDGFSLHGAKQPDKKVEDTGAELATLSNGYVKYIDLHLRSGAGACFADAPPAAKEGLACGSVLLRPGDSLMLPVAWGLHYDVAGHMADDPKTVASAQGWMINANDPAQAVDIITKETGVQDTKPGVTAPQ